MRARLRLGGAGWRYGPAVGLLALAAFAQHVRQELAAHVVHVDDEGFNGVREVVVNHEGRNGDEEAGGRRDECFRDTGGGGAETALTRRSHRAEGVDDTDDRAEEADERAGGRDRTETREAGLHLRDLALFDAVDG